MQRRDGALESASAYEKCSLERGERNRVRSEKRTGTFPTRTAHELRMSPARTFHRENGQQARGEYMGLPRGASIKTFMRAVPWSSGSDGRIRTGRGRGFCPVCRPGRAHAEAADGRDAAAEGFSGSSARASMTGSGDGRKRSWPLAAG